jgi:opacity protein-like surface antigen
MRPDSLIGATGVEVKKSFVGSVMVAAVAISAPALAADIAPYSVAKGPIIGGFDWEGFYVGGHIGSATDSATFTQDSVSWTSLVGGFPGGPPTNTTVSTGESGTLGATTVTGGMQVGYNWVLPGPFLVGLEADISGTGLSSTVLTSPPGDPFAVASWNDKLDVYGSVRARAGWLVDNWLFYGTAGFGWAYDKFTRSQLTAPLSINAPFVDTRTLQAGTFISHSHLRAGWVAGVGAEWAFARTWTLKLEYLHFDTESETINAGHFSYLTPPIAGPPPVGPQTSSSSVTFSQGGLTIDTVRIGFNHTFN